MAKKPVLPVVSVRASPSVISEGNEGDSNQIQLTVELSQAAGRTGASVKYAIRPLSGSTAEPGIDYTHQEKANGTLVFRPGESSKVIHLSITPDDFLEADEKNRVFTHVRCGSKTAFQQVHGDDHQE
jgi:chitinase